MFAWDILYLQKVCQSLIEGKSRKDENVSFAQKLTNHTNIGVVVVVQIVYCIFTLYLDFLLSGDRICISFNVLTGFFFVFQVCM